MYGKMASHYILQSSKILTPELRWKLNNMNFWNKKETANKNHSMNALSQNWNHLIISKHARKNAFLMYFQIWATITAQHFVKMILFISIGSFSLRANSIYRPLIERAPIEVKKCKVALDGLLSVSRPSVIVKIVLVSSKQDVFCFS